VLTCFVALSDRGGSDFFYFLFPNTKHVSSHQQIFHNQARAPVINCSGYFRKEQER
jgi:hypothetical protein